MGEALKLNLKTRKYKPYELPDGSTSSAWYEMNDDEVITCAECGKKLLFGDGHTSRNIFDLTKEDVNEKPCVVCKDCFDKELDEESMEVE